MDMGQCKTAHEVPLLIGYCLCQPLPVQRGPRLSAILFRFVCKPEASRGARLSIMFCNRQGPFLQPRLRSTRQAAPHNPSRSWYTSPCSAMSFAPLTSSKRLKSPGKRNQEREFKQGSRLTDSRPLSAHFALVPSISPGVGAC